MQSDYIIILKESTDLPPAISLGPYDVSDASKIYNSMKDIVDNDPNYKDAQLWMVPVYNHTEPEGLVEEFNLQNILS